MHAGYHLPKSSSAFVVICFLNDYYVQYCKCLQRLSSVSQGKTCSGWEPLALPCGWLQPLSVPLLWVLVLWSSRGADALLQTWPIFPAVTCPSGEWMNDLGSGLQWASAFLTDLPPAGVPKHVSLQNTNMLTGKYTTGTFSLFLNT